MKIAIASDHAGYKLKSQLQKFLEINFIDVGTFLKIVLIIQTMHTKLLNI